MSDDSLKRFLEARHSVYDQALSELRSGRKRTHWMWFIFPQMRGLGRSPSADYYGIESREEAERYLAHEVLGARLRECIDILLGLPTNDPAEVFGNPDDLKLRSCLTLFAEVGGHGSAFSLALDKFLGDLPDEATLMLLERSGGNV
jgi:uncharacterized protein (DUF1810 family)